MIIFCKSSELESITDKLEQIEERFWINYKNFDAVNRAVIRDNFETVYKKLDEIMHKEQIEMDLEKEN